ncbi:MAG: hypothetical protein PUA88_03825 [Bacillales bacterium]|nr:hypothetical protein [Bacillales bacterium]
MENDSYNKKDPLTLSKIFKVVLNKWWLLIITATSITAIGTVGAKFLNSKKETYTSQFSYNIPSLKDGKFIDGTNFTYQYFIDYSRLEQVKESNNDYKSINIDKLYKSDYLEIKHILEYSNVTNEIISDYYEIMVPQNVFPSKQIAESFINDLINQPINYTIEAQKNINYFISLESFNEAYSYEMQIELLESQYELLVENYQNLINVYGNVQINENSLLEYVRELNIYYENNKLSNFSQEIIQKGYVKDSTKEKELLELEKEKLQNDIKYNEAKIDELKELIKYLVTIASSNVASLQLDSYNVKITELTIENVDMQKRIKEIDNKLNSLGNVPASFTDKLNAYKDYLDNHTHLYMQNEEYILKKYSTVTYKNQKVLKSNDASIIKSLAVCLVMGLVIGSTINFIIDYKKFFRKQTEEN